MSETDLKKRDLLKALPLAPVALAGGMAGGLVLPALAQSPGSSVRTARVVPETHLGPLDAIRIHLIDPVIDSANSVIDWYQEQREITIEALCSELAELVNSNFDIRIDPDACLEIVDRLLDDAEDAVVALTFGRVSWVLVAGRYILLVTKSQMLR